MALPDVITRNTTSTVDYPPHIRRWVEDARRKGYSIVSYNFTELPGQAP